MGCSYILHAAVAIASYRSKQVVAEFLFCLSDSIKQKKVLLKMKSSPIFSILIDESTDVSVLKLSCTMAVTFLMESTF